MVQIHAPPPNKNPLQDLGFAGGFYLGKRERRLELLAVSIGCEYWRDRSEPANKTIIKNVRKVKKSTVKQLITH